LARGSSTTLIRSSSGWSLPCASSCAITSSASLPAGSSPCCWPTSSTVGRALRPGAATPASRVKYSASSGTPACELPTWMSRTVVAFAAPGSSRTRLRSRLCSSALLVKVVRPGANAGVR
jgi:hypothetical protein